MRELIFKKRRTFLMAGLLLVGILMFSVPVWATIGDPGVGDLNENGAITVTDVLLLRRYIVGGWGVSIDESLGDCNNSGSVTVADVLKLRRFIVEGWGVLGNLNSKGRKPEIIKTVPVDGGQVATIDPTFIITFSESMDITSDEDCIAFWLRNDGPERTVGITVGNDCDISGIIGGPTTQYVSDSWEKNETILKLKVIDVADPVRLRKGSSYSWSMDVFALGVTRCGSCGSGILDAGGDRMDAVAEDLVDHTFSVAP